jgi:hypothetical protein
MERFRKPGRNAASPNSTAREADSAKSMQQVGRVSPSDTLRPAT